MTSETEMAALFIKLQEANDLVKGARIALNDAIKAEQDASRFLDDTQREINVAVHELKKQAPHGSVWHDDWLEILRKQR